MSNWRNGWLDLGLLGFLEVWESTYKHPKKWYWEWTRHGECTEAGGAHPSRCAAQRAAEKWLRVALKQANKKIGGKL